MDCRNIQGDTFVTLFLLTLSVENVRPMLKERMVMVIWASDAQLTEATHGLPSAV